MDTLVALAELLLQVLHGALAMGTDAPGLRFVVVTEATCQEHRQTLGVLESIEWLVHELRVFSQSMQV